MGWGFSKFDGSFLAFNKCIYVRLAYILIFGGLGQVTQVHSSKRNNVLKVRDLVALNVKIFLKGLLANGDFSYLLNEKHISRQYRVRFYRCNILFICSVIV